MRPHRHHRREELLHRLGGEERNANLKQRSHDAGAEELSTGNHPRHERLEKKGSRSEGAANMRSRKWQLTRRR
eukprot:699910-Pleurochrysis_carterae.AAC.1